MLKRNSPTFGEELMAERIKRNLSRYEFAKAVGLSSSDNIRRYEETGTRPQMDVYLRIVAFLESGMAEDTATALENMSTQDLLTELTRRGFRVSLEQL
jgi:transcriptional regulator with XRE-family HTH domain